MFARQMSRSFVVSQKDRLKPLPEDGQKKVAENYLISTYVHFYNLDSSINELQSNV
jgi:hypothetical protein